MSFNKGKIMDERFSGTNVFVPLMEVPKEEDPLHLYCIYFWLSPGFNSVSKCKDGRIS